MTFIKNIARLPARARPPADISMPLTSDALSYKPVISTKLNNKEFKPFAYMVLELGRSFNRLMRLILACCVLGVTEAHGEERSAILTEETGVSFAPSALALSSRLIEQGRYKDFRFARKYSAADIVNDPSKAREFLKEYFSWEREYFKIARINGLGITVDGYNLDPRTLNPTEVREYTAASKECLDIAIQVKALKRNEYAILLAGNGDADVARKVAVVILRSKMNSYMAFNEKYPGFGGFLPWVKAARGKEGHTVELEPAEYWRNGLPAVDNGEWVWSIYAAYHALHEIGEFELAARYKEYFDMLKKNATAIFYDKALHRIRGEVKIADTMTGSADTLNYSTGYTIEDCYEALTMVYFLDLFSDLPQAEKDRMWEGVKMEKVTTLWGSVYKAWPKEAPLDGSPHIKWAFLLLPITDNPIAMKVYGLQEKIRTNLHRYGIPVSVNTPGGVGYTHYSPNVFGLYGAFSIIHYYALQGDVTANNYGLAALVTMMKVDKMQTPLGSGEAYSVKPNTSELDEVSFVLTADGKMTLWLAIMGGNVEEIRQALKKDGLYKRFIWRVNREYRNTFESVSSIKENAQFRLLQEAGGPYRPAKPARTTEYLGMDTLWKNHPGITWGEKTSTKQREDRLEIEYLPSHVGGWGWAGGALSQPITPGEKSALYIKGEGGFLLKLEAQNKSDCYSSFVRLRGKDVWIKIPLKDAAGKTFFVVVFDKIFCNVMIADVLFSPEGDEPAGAADSGLAMQQRELKKEIKT